jgi:L-amino acid N-acyltransferase YncA
VERGRGWALSIALIMLPYYKNTNPTLATLARQMIENVLCDSDINNSPIIRFANTSDAEQVAMCHVASWQKIYRGHIPDAVLDTLSVKEREKKWRDLLAKNVKVLVIERDKHIVGFASLCPSRDKDTDPKHCGEISAIYLHPDVWHQGVGKKLCTAAVSELEKMGFTEVIVWVLKENDQARNFYTAMGFNETNHSKLETYIQDVVLNEVCYKKNLS